MNIARKVGRGQILVIFALALLALLAVSALVLDGGQIFMNRRSAQTAADAGALAGAHEYCFGNPANAAAEAQQYAQTENYSTTASVNVNTIEQTVRVDTTISHPTFLAQLLGRDTAEVQASATAGCYYPGAAEHLLPIAWSCRPPVTESISGVCQEKGLDWGDQLKPLIDGKDLDGNPISKVTIDGVDYTTPYVFKNGIVDNRVYIIMDSDQAGIDHCVEIPGGGDELTCDMDGDGSIDLLGSGDRSWLYIDEYNLKKSITNFFGLTLSVHTWSPGQTGVNAAVLDTISDEIISKQSIVLVPVVNAVCPKSTGVNSSTCQDAAHTGTTGVPLEPGESDIVLSGNGNTYYHIVGFAPFYVTCVKKKGSDKCAGHTWAVDYGNMKDNVKTIEGYFIDNYPIDNVYGSGGIDLGIRIVSLTE